MVSMLAVGILIASIAIISMQTTTRTSSPNGDTHIKNRRGPGSISRQRVAMVLGVCVGTDSSECAMPEAPYETDDIAFSDEDGNEIDGILGKREGNRVNGMVNGISSDEEAMFAGTERSRRRGVGYGVFEREKMSVGNDSVWF